METEILHTSVEETAEMHKPATDSKKPRRGKKKSVIEPKTSEVIEILDVVETEESTEVTETVEVMESTEAVVTEVQEFSEGIDAIETEKFDDAVEFTDVLESPAQKYVAGFRIDAPRGFRLYGNSVSVKPLKRVKGAVHVLDGVVNNGRIRVAADAAGCVGWANLDELDMYVG